MEPQDAAINELIEEDHKRLKQNMATLSAEIERPVTDDTFPSWKLTCLWHLRDFQNQLLKHFDLEEEGGFMNDVLGTAPQYAVRIEHLEEEHRKIIADLNHAIAVLKSIQIPSSSKIARVRQRVHELLALLKNHEAAEHDLIQDIYYQDFGGGD